MHLQMKDERGTAIVANHSNGKWWKGLSVSALRGTWTHFALGSRLAAAWRALIFFGSRTTSASEISTRWGKVCRFEAEVNGRDPLLGVGNERHAAQRNLAIAVFNETAHQKNSGRISKPWGVWSMTFRLGADEASRLFCEPGLGQGKNPSIDFSLSIAFEAMARSKPLSSISRESAPRKNKLS